MFPSLTIINEGEFNQCVEDLPRTLLQLGMSNLRLDCVFSASQPILPWRGGKPLLVRVRSASGTEFWQVEMPHSVDMPTGLFGFASICNSGKVDRGVRSHPARRFLDQPGSVRPSTPEG